MPTENTKILAGVNLLRKAHAAGLLTDRDVYDVLKSSKRLQQQSFVSIDVLDECIRSTGSVPPNLASSLLRRVNAGSVSERTALDLCGALVKVVQSRIKPEAIAAVRNTPAFRTLESGQPDEKPSQRKGPAAPGM